MAKRSKLRLPLTVVLRDADGNREENQELSAKRRIAANSLQSSNVNFGSWNRTTLLRRISSGSGRSLGVLYLQVEPQNGTFVVSLSSGETISIEEIAKTLHECQNYAVIFLETSGELRALQDTVKILGLGTGAVLLTASLSDFGFALATEATNFRQTQTVDGQSGTLEIVYQFVESSLCSLGFVFSDQSHSCEVIHPNGDLGDKTLWDGGSIFATDVDIDKILGSARKEQVDDTVKRLLDAAQHPRYAHLPTEQRLISTQSVLWLTQVEQSIDLRDWVLSTTLFLEVYPDHAVGPAQPRYVRRTEPNVDELGALIESFVRVPSDEYTFGRNQNDIPSEPPANSVKGILKGFWISRCLITELQWCALYEGAIGRGLYFPKHDVNFFDAQDFCRALLDTCSKEIFERYGRVRVELPTEYQWEAAASGREALDYPWGNRYVPDNCNADMRIGQTTEVFQFLGRGSSPFGILDAAGNLREWTRSYAGTQGNDWRAHDFDRISGEDSVVTPMSRVVIRGGSYSYDPDCVQTWVRNTQIASRHDNQTGFRVVLEDE